MKWHPLFQGIIRNLYYSRITITGGEQVPIVGPLLVLCLHRNGAVDGFVYRGAIPDMLFMVKAGLRRSLFGRIFFDGVEVVRHADSGKRDDKFAVIETCAAHLEVGGRLAIFPEGTSQLGPRHLPFKSGAARIAARYLESGRTLNVVALGIHYECPWAFRSRVEVVIGPVFTLSPPADQVSSRSQLVGIKDRFTSALENVGLNVTDQDHFEMAQKFAYIATLGTGIRYVDALKSFERKLPVGALSAWRSFEAKARGKRLLRHQGVPLFPLKMTWAYGLLTLLLALPVLGGVVLNLPPLAVAVWAGRRFPDDTNVIALWRVLTGVPLFLMWGLAFLLVALVLEAGWLAAAYVALTCATILGWYRLKKLAVISWNGLFQPQLKADAIAIHQAVLSTFQSTSNEHSTAPAASRA